MCGEIFLVAPCNVARYEPRGDDDALVHVTLKANPLQKSWKSLDSACMEELLGIQLDSIHVLEFQEAKPYSNLLTSKQKITTALPPPSKFPSSRRNELSREYTQSSFSNLDGSFYAELEVHHVPEPVDHFNDLCMVASKNNIATDPQYKVRRCFQRMVNFAAGLDNEAERRRQGSWQ